MNRIDCAIGYFAALSVKRNGRPEKPIPAEALERARAMRAQGLGWAEIARAIAEPRLDKTTWQRRVEA